MKGYKEGEILVNKTTKEENKIVFKRRENGSLWYFLRSERVNFNYPYTCKELNENFDRKQKSEQYSN